MYVSREVQLYHIRGDQHFYNMSNILISCKLLQILQLLNPEIDTNFNSKTQISFSTRITSKYYTTHTHKNIFKIVDVILSVYEYGKKLSQQLKNLLCWYIMIF